MDHGLGPISERGVATEAQIDLAERHESVGAFDDPALADVRQVFERTLAGWVGDLLTHRPSLDLSDPRSLEEQAADDYRDRDWSRLYRGSVLDD